MDSPCEITNQVFGLTYPLSPISAIAFGPISNLHPLPIEKFPLKTN
jgi:hypothetical protein